METQALALGHLAARCGFLTLSGKILQHLLGLHLKKPGQAML